MSEENNSIKKERVPFTMVANTILGSIDISLKAKGLYAFMYSKPDGWNFTTRSMSKQLKEGRDSIMSALNELKDAGIIEYEKHNNGSGTYHIASDISKDEPKSDNPGLVNPTVGKPDRISNTDLTNNTDTYKDVDAFENAQVPPVSEKELEKEHRMNEALVVAGYLYGSMEVSLDKVKPITDATKLKWAKDIEKLIRIDGNKNWEIVKVIDWIHKGKGSFWIPNIQSGKKLREQFPTLWAQMTQDAHKLVSSKNRILSEVGLGKVFFDYPDKDLDARVHVCLYGEYNALYDFYRNKYIDKDKAVKVWAHIDEHVNSILIKYRSSLS